MPSGQVPLILPVVDEDPLRTGGERDLDLGAGVLSQCMTQFILRIVNPVDQARVAESGGSVGRDLLKELPAVSKGQAIVAGAVDWTAAATRLPANALPLKGPVARLVFPGWTTTTGRVVFDPEKSKALRDEAGYSTGLPILILLSEEDEDLLGVAKWIHGDLLTNLGLETKYRVEPAESDWAEFAESPERQMLDAELFTFAKNIGVELWGPSPTTPEPLRPGK